jgi:hypothetical protein
MSTAAAAVATGVDVGPHNRLSKVTWVRPMRRGNPSPSRSRSTQPCVAVRLVSSYQQPYLLRPISRGIILGIIPSTSSLNTRHVYNNAEIRRSQKRGSRRIEAKARATHARVLSSGSIDVTTGTIQHSNSVDIIFTSVVECTVGSVDRLDTINWRYFNSSSHASYFFVNYY